MKREATKVHGLWPVLCPELAMFASAEAARSALRRANAQYFRLAWLWVIVAGLIGVSILIGIYLPLCVASRIGVYMTIGLWNLIPALVVMLVVRHRIRRSIRLQLVEHGVPVCLHCGYSLQGLSGPRCPECGHTNSSLLKVQE